MITADFTKNKKQGSFLNTVLECAFGFQPFRYLFYGGAIRGGKTYACLVTLIMLCKIFPGSKWYVLRRSFSNIKETTLPTMNKILGRSPNWKWSRDVSNYFCENIQTGSRIYFAGENFIQDPTMNWLLGLECNGFFLEQVEELQQLTMDMCISRAGSWIISKMPTPIIMGSFNPTMTWVRTKIYAPWLEGLLKSPWYYQDASPTDNPYVTPEQWKGWENMEQGLYDQFIGGSWDFAKPPNVFAYAFDEKKHHLDCGFNSDHVLRVAFDFNVDPIVCLFEQHEEDWTHIFKEFRLLNSDIWALTDHIIAEFPAAFFMITGDASGQNRSAMVQGNKNYYKIIREQLQIGTTQVRVPRANPSIRNTRVLSNSLLAKHPGYKINTKQCPHLTIDLNSVVVDENGDIDEGRDKRKGHLLDAWRYNNWTWHRDFLDKNIYQYTAND